MSNGTAPFWNFSLAFYALPNVPPSLLPLQDEFGADVNLVLYGLFRATQMTALTRQDFAALDGAVHGWRQDVIEPARALRRMIKSKQSNNGDIDALYAQAKKLELEAERLHQFRLDADGATIAPGNASPTLQDAAADNLRAYAALLGENFPQQTIEFLVASLTDLNRRTSGATAS